MSEYKLRMAEMEGVEGNGRTYTGNQTFYNAPMSNHAEIPSNNFVQIWSILRSKSPSKP
jgi:hypothetical protein